LEMLRADFLAAANLDNGDPEMLLFSMTRFFRFLPEEQRLRQVFLEGASQKVAQSISPKLPRLRTDPVSYENLPHQVLHRDGWRCQCGS